MPRFQEPAGLSASPRFLIVAGAVWKAMAGTVQGLRIKCHEGMIRAHGQAVFNNRIAATSVFAVDERQIWARGRHGPMAAALVISRPGSPPGPW